MPKHYVNISKSAMAQILMNGFEAFVVKHGEKKRHAIEMHASLFGDVEKNRQSIHHNVQFISVDTSAKMSGSEVVSRHEAWSLKKTMGAAMGFNLLADLHTHPYLAHEMTLREMRQEGSWFSKGDRAAFRQLVDEHMEPYFLAGVLGIRNKNQRDDGSLKQERLSNKRDGFIAENMFEFTLADCKCFIHFQAFELDDEGELCEVPTAINCDYLKNFSYIGASFGSVAVAEGKQRIVEHKS